MTLFMSEIVVLAFLRVFLIISCIEVAVRYGFWWRKTQLTDAHSVFGILMLGISITMISLGLRLIFAELAAPEPTYFYSIGGLDLLLLCGIMCHLIPCWRIGLGYSRLKICAHMALRLATAATMTWMWLLSA